MVQVAKKSLSKSTVSQKNTLVKEERNDRYFFLSKSENVLENLNHLSREVESSSTFLEQLCLVCSSGMLATREGNFEDINFSANCWLNLHY